MKENNIFNILKNSANAPAILCGNSINLYKSKKDEFKSWEAILLDLWNIYVPFQISVLPKGVSYPELFNIIELYHNNQNSSYDLQKHLSKEMKNWKLYDHHKKFIDFCKIHNIPVLTTNFDKTLSNCLLNKSIKHIKGYKFNSFYPWSSYYSGSDISSPSQDFAIWNIHGTIDYPVSLRFGLTQYAGLIEKTRKFLHKGGDERLFSGKNQHLWIGHKTWLHIIFNNDLLIFGLDFDQNEIFLRWLLMERKFYFHKFPDRLKRGWFIYQNNMTPGKKLFFETAGFDLIEIEKWDDFYNIF